MIIYQIISNDAARVMVRVLYHERMARVKDELVEQMAAITTTLGTISTGMLLLVAVVVRVMTPSQRLELQLLPHPPSVADIDIHD